MKSDPPALATAGQPVRGLILGYHRVTTLASDPYEMCLPPAQFRDQMAYLESHCHPLSLTELVSRAQSGDLPPRAVAVTFDDGYRDVLTNASPILLERGIPATFFVVTEALDGVAFWWDSLHGIFCSGKQLPSTLELDLPGETRRLDTRNHQEHRDAFWALYDVFRPLLAKPRDALVRELSAWSGIDPNGAPRATLTRGELLELAARPRHSMAAHTVHHLTLPNHPADVQEREIVDCKSDLEELLGEPVPALAYPYGAWNRTSVELARAAGFALGVTCHEAALQVGVDPMLVPRRLVSRDRARDFPRWLDACFEAGDGDPGATPGV